MNSNIEIFKDHYKDHQNLYKDFRKDVVIQINELLSDEKIIVGFPIESRVKTWDSIYTKCQSKELQLKSINDIKDIIGVRIVVLFKKDLDKICKTIEDNFIIINKEDATSRLSENQFGYGSIHFDVKPKDEWFKMPTFKKFIGLVLEIQVRTAPQHIWAAASHVLQYKDIEHVPIPLRRAVNRTAALLEIVDNEFDRVIKEREIYIEETELNMDEKLNVDNLKLIMDNILPDLNRRKDENYSDLLDDLLHFKIDTIEKLKKLYDKHKNEVLKQDKDRAEKTVNDIRKGILKLPEEDIERVKKGASFYHVGLIRNALSSEFKDDFKNYSIKKFRNKVNFEKGSRGNK